MTANRKHCARKVLIIIGTLFSLAPVFLIIWFAWNFRPGCMVIKCELSEGDTFAMVTQPTILRLLLGFQDAQPERRATGGLGGLVVVDPSGATIGSDYALHPWIGPRWLDEHDLQGYVVISQDVEAGIPFSPGITYRIEKIPEGASLWLQGIDLRRYITYRVQGGEAITVQTKNAIAVEKL